MTNVYVARKVCGHIVAAFPLNIEQKAKAEIAKQLISNGVDITQVDESEVSLMFKLDCDCQGRPPLLVEIDMVDLHRQAEEMAERDGALTISLLQRRLRVGWQTAARIMEERAARRAVSVDTSTGEILDGDSFRPTENAAINDLAEDPQVQAEEAQAEGEAEQAKTEEDKPTDSEASEKNIDNIIDNLLNKKDDEEDE